MVQISCKMKIINEFIMLIKYRDTYHTKSYYSPILQNTLNMIEVEGADAHEAQGFEQGHVHVLGLVEVYRLIMRILPNHTHFALRHQIFNAFVNFADH